MTATNATLTGRETRLAILTGLGTGLLWLLLGLAGEGTTYHLGPLLAAGLPVLIYSLESPAVASSKILWLAAGGLVLALAITAVLAATEKLSGGSLLPFGGAATEAILFALFGALSGALTGAWRQHAEVRP